MNDDDRVLRNFSATQAAMLIGFSAVGCVALSLILWKLGFHVYAVAYMCFVALSLVCGAIGLYHDRKHRALYGSDSQEWKELEKRGWETGKLCGKVVPWPMVVAVSLHLSGYPQTVVVVAFAAAFAIATAFLVVASRRMRRKWPPIHPPTTLPQH